MAPRPGKSARFIWSTARRSPGTAPAPRRAGPVFPTSATGYAASRRAGLRACKKLIALPAPPRDAPPEAAAADAAPVGTSLAPAKECPCRQSESWERIRSCAPSPAPPSAWGAADTRSSWSASGAPARSFSPATFMPPQGGRRSASSGSTARNRRSGAWSRISSNGKGDGAAPSPARCCSMGCPVSHSSCSSASSTTCRAPIVAATRSWSPAWIARSPSSAAPAAWSAS